MLSILKSKKNIKDISKKIPHHITLGKKVLVGIDYGKNTVKLVKAVVGHPTILSCKSFFVSQTTKDEIISFIREKKLLKRPLALSLPDENVEQHEFKIPKLSKEEADKAIEWEIKKILPSSDFIVKDILTLDTEDKIGVECVMAPKDVVQNRFKEGEEYGLKPQYLETESSALLALLMKLNENKEINRTAVIDLGYSCFRIIFINNSQVAFTRALYMGLQSFESKGVREFVTMIFDEFERSAIFALEKGLEKVTRIYLCGGGACKDEIVSELVKILGAYEVLILNPFKSNYFKTDEDIVSGPLWACACGLVTR